MPDAEEAWNRRAPSHEAELRELRRVLVDAQTSIIAALILLPKGANGLQLLDEIIPKINDALLAKLDASDNQ
jgi:hypothetical protein